MRKALFLTMVLVLLAGTYVTASAQGVVLGDTLELTVTGLGPYEGVDVYLYRPSTLEGWPFTTGPDFGTYFWPMDESAWRRQSYPDYQEADVLGNYYAEFMLPRDEAWYPCSYPYKWNCNILGAGAVEFHSPVWQDDFEAGLAWPYYDSVYFEATDDFLGAWLLANPMDTVHPHVVIIDAESFDVAVGIPVEVLGYYWKVSDLEYDLDDQDFEFIPVP